MGATLSIVMPSFNQADFLEEAIESVLSQREHVNEFFILDGGSTDGSVEIIERYADRIDFWRTGPDGGQSNAIADGFERCTSSVLTWLNSDDALLQGAVRAMLDRFDANPDVGLIEGDTVVVNADSRVIRCDRRAGPSAWFMRHGHMRIHQPSTFFRRDLYESVGGVDRDLHCTMDTDLWYRMLPATRPERLSRYVGVHRIHEEAKGTASQWQERYRAEREQLRERYDWINMGFARYQTGRARVLARAVVSSRAASARRDSQRFEGKPLSEAFADEASLMTM